VKKTGVWKEFIFVILSDYINFHCQFSCMI